MIVLLYYNIILYNGGRMITVSVSNISEYIYCPLKLYLKYDHGEYIQTQDLITGKLVHEVRRDFEEF